jgi:Holliday junction resolvase
MPNRARKIDDNQNEIVKMLRRIGCSVAITSMVGKGFPDIICAFRGKNFLFEIKDGNKSESRKRLTPDEEKFFNTWQGQISKVESFDEILKIIQQ